MFSAVRSVLQMVSAVTIFLCMDKSIDDHPTAWAVIMLLYAAAVGILVYRMFVPQ